MLYEGGFACAIGPYNGQNFTLFEPQCLPHPAPCVHPGPGPAHGILWL
jgi:hypothetical protein